MIMPTARSMTFPRAMYDLNSLISSFSAILLEGDKERNVIIRARCQPLRVNEVFRSALPLKGEHVTGYANRTVTEFFDSILQSESNKRLVLNDQYVDRQNRDVLPNLCNVERRLGCKTVGPAFLKRTLIGRAVVYSF